MAIVEREREALLREHGEELRDYLPKGVIKNPKDYEVLFGRPPSEGDGERAYIMGRHRGSPLNVAAD